LKAFIISKLKNKRKISTIIILKKQKKKKYLLIFSIEREVKENFTNSKEN